MKGWLFNCTSNCARYPLWCLKRTDMCLCDLVNKRFYFLENPKRWRAVSCIANNYSPVFCYCFPFNFFFVSMFSFWSPSLHCFKSLWFSPPFFSKILLFSHEFLGNCYNWAVIKLAACFSKGGAGNVHTRTCTASVYLFIYFITGCKNNSALSLATQITVISMQYQKDIIRTHLCLFLLVYQIFLHIIDVFVRNRADWC